MFIATSAFLTIVNTDRKARTVRIASDNLNIALEDMQRRIKTGSTYNCGGTIGTADCAVTPLNIFAFTEQNGTTRTTYKRVSGATVVPTGCGADFGASQGCLLRNDVLATSPEIDIKDLKFIVKGSAVAPDTQQPVVVILVGGTVGTGAVATSFNIQTTVTQRAYDNQ